MTPRIPTQPLPGVEPTPLPTPFVGPGTVAAAARPSQLIAAGAAVVAREARNISIMLERRSSSTVKTAALNDLRKAEHDLAFGDSGYIHVKGVDALDAEKSANEELKKRRDAIGEGIAKARTRDEWLAETEGRLLDFGRSAQLHSMKESEMAARLEWQTDQEGGLQDSLRNLDDFASNPDAALGDFFRTMGRHMQQATVRGKEMGWPDKFIDGEMEKFKSGALRAGIKSLIAQDQATVADELYSKTKKDHILPSDQDEIEPTLGPAKDRERGQARVADMFDGVTELNFDADKRTEINDEIDAEEDAGQKAVMRAEVDKRFSNIGITRAQRDDENVLRLWKQLEAEPDATKLQTDDYFQNHLNEGDRDMLERRAKLLSQGKQFADATDWERVQGEWTFEIFRDEEGNITGQQRRSLDYQSGYNLLKLQPYMTETDWKSIRREQNAAISASSTAARKGPSAYGNAHQRMRELVNQSGDESLALLKEDPATMARLEGKVRKAVEDLTHDPERKGRPISGPERDEMLGRVLAGEFTDDGFRFDTVSETNWGNTVVPVFVARLLEVDDERQMTFDGEVPPQESRLVKDALRRRFGGREPTADEVQKAYGQHVVGNDDEMSAFLEAAIQNEAREDVSATQRIEEEIDPSILGEVQRFVRLSNGNPDDPSEVLNAWREMRSMFQQSAAALSVGPGGIGVGPTDEQKNRMVAAAAMYATLRKAGKTDLEARTMLNLIVPFSELRRELRPPPAEGANAAE